MSGWPGKYIIGVTGNICVGKSVVCKILEDIGAQIVDADIVAHDVMKSCSTVFQDIVDAFGVRILKNSGEMRTWLSNDNLKLPVKIELKTNIGTMVMKLKERK